jgi:gliding motility-associated GldL-like protein
MYSLTDEQIEFMRKDIISRGIQIADLQDDLLDHICCMIEDKLEHLDDFEAFYSLLITTFYKHELKEIEEETITLLTFKNYYVMKKVMLLSGGILTALLTIGIILKFMHLPGAAIMIFLGVMMLSFVFLPLFFTLKIKEQRKPREKAIIGIATFAGILISIGVLFKIMHWPGANILCLVALGMMLFVFLPIYFFSGIRNPETKVNTIVSSVFILYGCALLIVLIRAPHATQAIYAANTDSLLRSERILSEQQRQTEMVLAKNNSTTQVPNGKEISELCEKVKSFLVKSETGKPKLIADGTSISEASANDYFSGSAEANAFLERADAAILSYNQSLPEGFQEIEPLQNIKQRRITQAITDLIQTQIILLQNQTAGSLLK